MGPRGTLFNPAAGRVSVRRSGDGARCRRLVHPGKRLIPLKLRALLDFAAPRLQQRLAEVQAVMGGR